MVKSLKFGYVLVVVLLTAYLSSIFSRYGTSGWYQTLPKPDITPPDYVFPIVWTLLYALIIAATYIMITNSQTLRRNLANDLFLAQSFLQILWCFTFFAHGYLALGLVVIVLLDIAVIKMTQLYFKINNLAGWLVTPYCFWALFATMLNVAYVWMHGLSV